MITGIRGFKDRFYFIKQERPSKGWSLYKHDAVAMVTTIYVSTFTEPQNIEQGISNVEVTPS